MVNNRSKLTSRHPCWHAGIWYAGLWHSRFLAAVLLLLTSSAASSLAGGGPENVFLLVNSTSRDSLTVANHYIDLRKKGAENREQIRELVAAIMGGTMPTKSLRS